MSDFDDWKTCQRCKQEYRLEPHLCHDTQAHIVRLKNIEVHARRLIDDVHRRYPGDPLLCPYMIALELALNAK